MRKKILSATFLVVMMAAAGYNVYMSQTKADMSELALANVEALAEDENEPGSPEDCNTRCKEDANYNCTIVYNTGRSRLCEHMRKS